MFRLFCSMLLAIAFAAPQAAAADQFDTLDKGPKVGRAIPHSLAVRDHNDQHRDFKSLARRRGLIVLFSRSLDW
jgi:hypothetical protein